MTVFIPTAALIDAFAQGTFHPSSSHAKAWDPVMVPALSRMECFIPPDLIPRESGGSSHGSCAFAQDEEYKKRRMKKIKGAG